MTHIFITKKSQHLKEILKIAQDVDNGCSITDQINNNEEVFDIQFSSIDKYNEFNKKSTDKGYNTIHLNN